MGQFSLYAILLCCLAAAFAVSALWQQARTLAAALLLLIPLGAGALYWHLGRPAAVEASNTAVPQTLPAAITQLEQLSKAEPKSSEHAATLARAYAQAGQWPQARDAYARALALQDDPELSVDYAEALLRTSPDRRFPPEAVQRLESALKANPNQQRALFFLGLHQRQSKQPAKAAETWTRLLALLDPQNSRELRVQIDEARKEAGLEPITPASATLVEVSVDLDGKLAQMIGVGTTLYVMARQPEQAGPPVAARRIEAHKYPLEIKLSDDDSVMPTQALSTHSEVVLVARISRSGDPIRGHGDLESAPITVQLVPGAKAHLVINRVVP